jgi:hypothetical protein
LNAGWGIVLMRNAASCAFGALSARVRRTAEGTRRRNDAPARFSTRSANTSAVAPLESVAEIPPGTTVAVLNAPDDTIDVANALRSPSTLVCGRP